MIFSWLAVSLFNGVANNLNRLPNWLLNGLFPLDGSIGSAPLLVNLTLFHSDIFQVLWMFLQAFDQLLAYSFVALFEIFILLSENVNDFLFLLDLLGSCVVFAHILLPFSTILLTYLLQSQFIVGYCISQLVPQLIVLAGHQLILPDKVAQFFKNWSCWLVLQVIRPLTFLLQFKFLLLQPSNLLLQLFIPVCCLLQKTLLWLFFFP